MPYLRANRRGFITGLGRRWAADQCPFSGVKQALQIHGGDVG
jgi:hypothetical protein